MRWPGEPSTSTQANMKTVLPNFYQQVDFATKRGEQIGLGYANIKKALRAVPCPHLGSSDHLSVTLIPAYQPLLTKEKPAVKEVRVWPEGAMSALQDCWSMFKEAATYNQHTDVGEYATSVSGYIQWCMEEVVVTVTNHVAFRGNWLVTKGDRTRSKYTLSN